MFFPVSGVEIHPLVPFLVALVVSFFTSMGGVSGAFILLPFQVSFLGYTSPSVSATNHVFNIIAIPSGIYRYFKEGRMLWPLTRFIIIGTLPGVFIGAWIRIEYLPDPKKFKLFVGLVLIYIGCRVFLDLVKKSRRNINSKQYPSKSESFKIEVKQSSLKTIHFSQAGESFSFSPFKVILLCLVVGIIGGIYGIGGGSIISPFLVAIFGLPVYAIAGAALAGTLTTSIAGVFFYHLLSLNYPEINVAPDWFLGCLFGLGGLIGMYLGARTQRYVSDRLIKSILCFCIMFVAARYLTELF